MSLLHLLLVKNLKFYPIKLSHPIPKLLTRKKYYRFKAISLGDNSNPVYTVSPQINCLAVTDLDEVNVETELKQVVSFQEDPDLILHVGKTSENAVYQETDIGSSVDPEDTFTNEEPPYEFLSNPLRRISTFKNWPFVDHHYIIQLASAGFYFTGAGDLVKCFHCHGSLQYTVPKKDPFMEHLIKFKRCGFIRQERDIQGQSVMCTSLTGSVFYQGTQQISHPLMPHNFEEIFPAVQDVIQTPGDIYLHDRRNRYLADEEVHDENPNQDIVTQASARDFNLLQWHAPSQNLSFHQRLETFQGTSEIFRNPRLLARAGFSYDVYTEAIKCFYCGGGLCSLRLPSYWTIYSLLAAHSPDCLFIECLLRVRQLPGNEYGRNLDIEGNNIIDVLEEDVHQIHPSLRCRKCKVIRACLMFLPCRHLYCLECGFTVDQCYVCGDPVSHFIVVLSSTS